METLTLKNDYHRTYAWVRIHADRETILSRRTVRRLRRALCGIDGCTCGGVLGQRGQQRHILHIADIAAMPHGEAMIRLVEAI